MTAHAGAAIVATVGGALLAGCAALGAPHVASTPTSKLAEAQSTHEYPAPAAPGQRASGTGGDPVAAIRMFATHYINWDAGNVAVRMRDLAGRSVGQARSAMLLAAAETARDYELQRGGIANRGSVEAVAPLSGHSDRYVVVTREQTSAADPTLYQGLRPAWHVAIATVVRVGTGRWALSGWQPQN